jgi:hypothetical protein
MLTGEIRNQIDRIWDSFWSGGISNPLAVIEQITYLLFPNRLAELETAEELKANRGQHTFEILFRGDVGSVARRPCGPEFTRHCFTPIDRRKEVNPVPFQFKSFLLPPRVIGLSSIN